MRPIEHTYNLQEIEWNVFTDFKHHNEKTSKYLKTQNQ